MSYIRKQAGPVEVCVGRMADDFGRRSWTVELVGSGITIRAQAAPGTDLAATLDANAKPGNLTVRGDARDVRLQLRPGKIRTALDEALAQLRPEAAGFTAITVAPEEVE